MSYRSFILATVAGIFIGCAITPRTLDPSNPRPLEPSNPWPLNPSIRKPLSIRLLRHRDFTTCLTGPWSPQWVKDLRWSGENEFASHFDALVLPIACEVYDVDDDGDVDLEDYARGVRDGFRH